MKRSWILLLILALLVWLAHPVCIPIPREQLKNYKPPVEQRDDRDLLLFRTFQLIDGRWCYCRSWIWRQLPESWVPVGPHGPQTPPIVTTRPPTPAFAASTGTRARPAAR